MTGIAPGRLCLHWMVPVPVWDSANRRSPSSRPALRLYRIDIGVPRPAGIIQFIDGADGLHRIDARVGVFVAEIGMIHVDGRFDRIAASDAATVPAAAESEDQSLQIIDLGAPQPPQATQASSPSHRFLRLFAQGRHDRIVIRRHAVPGGLAHPAPDGDHPPAAIPSVECQPPALSGAGVQDESGDGWPIALRIRPSDTSPPASPTVSRIAS